MKKAPFFRGIAALEPSLGTISIPGACLRSLSVEKRRADNLGDGLVFACDFESVTEIPNFAGGAIVPGKPESST